MNLQDIEAFVAVAETGSVNRAALRLHRTQPATTRRLQNLESALGSVPLLDRTARPPVLTPAGRRVLEHCRAVLKAVAELRASISGPAEIAGELRIGIAHGLADLVLDAPLDALRRRFPGLRLNLSSNWTRSLIEEVRSGALDCAIGLITREHALPRAIEARAIGPEEIVVVCGKKSALGVDTKRGVRLKDMAEMGWILNPEGCGCRSALQRTLDRSGLPMQVSAEVFGEELQLSMIARGRGAGLVPRRQLQRSSHRASVRIVRVRDFSLRATISILHGGSLGRMAEAVEQLHSDIRSELGRI
jgi:DNA-binding transcriptional LysR family regulator